MAIVMGIYDKEVYADADEYVLIILNPSAPIFKIQTQNVLINISSSFISHTVRSHVDLNTIVISITYDNYVELIDRWLNGEQFKNIYQLPTALQNEIQQNKIAAVQGGKS